MITSYIISAFLLAGVIGFLGVICFMLLNSREASLDDRTYRKDFCVRKDISSQYKFRAEQQEAARPKEALKRYALKQDGEQSPEPKVKIHNPVTDVPHSNDTDVVDAEIIDDGNAA